MKTKKTLMISTVLFLFGIIFFTINSNGNVEKVKANKDSTCTRVYYSEDVCNITYCNNNWSKDGKDTCYGKSPVVKKKTRNCNRGRTYYNGTRSCSLVRVDNKEPTGDVGAK